MYNLEEHFLKKVVALVFDYDRSNCYNRFLKEHAKDKTVVDCGSGSGLLSWLALKHGAKESYALDIVPSVLEHLSRLSKITNNLHVKNIDILTEDLPKGDLYVHEIFGHTIFEEGIHHLVDNLKRQGVTSLYPSKFKVYSSYSKNFTLRKFDRTKDQDKFNLNLLDIEVREFISVLENNFFGKIDYYSLLENDATVIELDQGEEETKLLNKKLVLDGDLFNLSPYNMPKIKDNIISWGFYFNDSTYLNLDSCQMTTWNQTVSTKFYLHNLRSQMRPKAIHHKLQLIKIYYDRLKNIT
jgi:hypothetical protein